MEIISIHSSTEAMNILSINPNTITGNRAKQITDEMLNGNTYFIMLSNLLSVLMLIDRMRIPRLPLIKAVSAVIKWMVPCNVMGRLTSAGKNARITAPIDHKPNNTRPTLYRDFSG